jgi:6-phosphofructokinase 2
VLHLVFPGPELAEREWRACADAVLRIDPRPDYVVLSGSLPPGVPTDFYADLAGRCAGRGSRVLLDTTGPALEQALNARIPLFLAKPNRKEFRQLFEMDADQPRDFVRRMESVVNQDVAEALVVTLGNQGALLVSRESKLHLRPPEIEGRAPVGAGDSFVSALVHCLAEGGDLAEAARHGVAAAAAAVKSRDPQLYRPEELEAMRHEVRVEDL